MRKLLPGGFFALILVGLLFLFGQRVSAQNPTAAPTPQAQISGDASRTVNSLAPDAITSLPMSNPFCSQPDPSVNQCLVNVRYWQANDNGTGNVLAYVLFSLDGKLRYRSNAFFENFVTYSYDMIPGGIKVACGMPNEGGFGALYGRAYTVDVKAYDVTNNWVLDDQLSVKCPAFILGAAEHMRPQRLLLLLVILILVLQVPGEPAQSAALQATSISLTMSDPTCAEAAPASGVCKIIIPTLVASGSDTSFSRVEVLVNGKLRVFMNGFFEATAYLTEQMLPGGLNVPCGRPNAGGKPDFGQSYLVATNAYMADGTSASNSMTIFCPAYDGQIFLPVTRKN